ncbi:MFS transporter [Clostridium butyricum]|jgi:predicted MFS family arabinose efflux permease|uniref:MFS transporter n=1 Tax=Clostridium butyricum TaxID=1492 RepID=A0A512TN42_CLOBU|nr:MFS transporter [Clostridium butyricum]NOW21618.1 putative MFS family arabinose efflux permease [Clostridium butyricum]GEQ21690.1 MFS transporter [Clostridium butyricum]
MKSENINKNSIILLLGLAGFIVMADNWVISPILPAVAENLNINISKAGLLITAYMIPFGVFQIIFGPLADRYGKKQVITFSIIMFTIATGLGALGSSLTNLAIYRGLTGIFAASVMPISLALIGDIFPMEKRQQAIGTFMGISFLGQGLSMAIGGTIAFFLNWRGVFVAYAVLSLIPTVLLIANYKKLPSEKNPNSEILKPYFRLLSNSNSLFTYFIVLLEGIFIVGSFSYTGSYIAKTYNLNYFSIGMILTAFGIMSVIGGRLSGKLANKFGQKKVLSLGLVFTSIADIIIFFFGNNIYLLILAVALLGLGFILTHSTLLTRATKFAHKTRGAVMSLVAFCFMGGGGVGTAIGGKIIISYSLNSLFLIYGLALIITLILSFFLIRDIEYLV